MQDLSLNLELTVDLAKLACQQAPGILLFPPSGAGVTRTHRHAQLLTWDLNSGPQAGIVSPLPTEPSAFAKKPQRPEALEDGEQRAGENGTET